MEYSNPFDNEEISSYTVKTYGDSVRQRRKQLNISLREMANRIGMSAVYLSDIENGNRPAPSGLNSGIDYISILEKELCLTESQKLVYRLMATISSLNANNLIDNYFINNPESLRFLLKAIENNLTNEEWKKMYKSIFSNN